MERHPAMCDIFRTVQVARAVSVPRWRHNRRCLLPEMVRIYSMSAGRLKWAKHRSRVEHRLRALPLPPLGELLQHILASTTRRCARTSRHHRTVRMIPATVNHMARCIGNWHTQDEVIAMGINDLPYVQYCTMDRTAFDERDYPTFIEIASSISYVAVASYKYCVERMSREEVTARINENVTYHPEIVREEMLF